MLKLNEISLIELFGKLIKFVNRSHGLIHKNAFCASKWTYIVFFRNKTEFCLKFWKHMQTSYDSPKKSINLIAFNILIGDYLSECNVMLIYKTHPA